MQCNPVQSRHQPASQPTRPPKLQPAPYERVYRGNGHSYCFSISVIEKLGVAVVVLAGWRSWVGTLSVAPC